MILYAKIAAVAIALGIAYYAGYDRMRDKHLIFVAEVKATGEAAEAAAQHAVEVAEVISEGVKTNYENQITDLRRRYANAGRLCDTRPSGSNVSKDTKPTGQPYDPASDPEFIGKCAMTTQQLVSLQQWIIKQQEARK